MKMLYSLLVLIILLSSTTLATTPNYFLQSVTANSAATDLSSAFAYPNPYNTSSGNTTITFTNLAAICSIRIYTAFGELVKTIQETDGDGQTTWDGNTDFGGVTASGTYWYLIESANDKKISKLIIIN